MAKLYFKYGAMNSGKSTMLLQSAHNYEERGMKVWLIKPSIDVRDGVDVVMAQGVTAIAQPGGSIRDWEVVQACNEKTPQVAMVYTGQRSFKH